MRADDPAGYLWLEASGMGGDWVEDQAQRGGLSAAARTSIQPALPHTKWLQQTGHQMHRQVGLAHSRLGVEGPRNNMLYAPILCNSSIPV
ncbi:Hypp175 [Branchiostoma lanceolatum]|uniref:Hypp175 protein n=1 Tax=Branchiostoma lanceolatum TaxID=7740 RepID=A0A8J9VY11_BRALA|nr:Hypp175 [Branchiostoma lanceolatum]